MWESKVDLTYEIYAGAALEALKVIENSTVALG